jgi:hypothetical protein
VRTNFPPYLFAFTRHLEVLTLSPAFSSLLGTSRRQACAPQATDGDLMDETPKTSSAKSGGISRREFARRAALASAVAAVAPAAIAAPAAPSNKHANVAAADRGGRPSDPVSSTLQQAADLPKLSPEGHAEVEARIQSILSQYASRFSDAQKADIRRLCALAQPPLDRLRAYALENGDGPGLYLKPLLEREKNPLENTRVGKTPDAPAKP